MTVDVSFAFEACVKHFQMEVESDNTDKVMQKLMGMTLSEILSDESLVLDSDFKISDLEADIKDFTVIAKVSNIEYDLDPEIIDVSVIEYLKGFLPKEQTIELKCVRDDDDLEELISDHIFYETNYDTKSFEFQILEKK
jgi:hypothetical protein